jgi:AraC-like DNA-binding protein
LNKILIKNKIILNFVKSKKTPMEMMNYYNYPIIIYIFMSNRFLWFILFLLTAIQIPAQKSNHFNDICELAFLETASQNMSTAVKSADFFDSSLKNPFRKEKIWIFSANLYQSEVNLQKSVYPAENEKSLINHTNDANRQINMIKNITIIILCVTLIILLIFFRSKQKKQHSKFKNIIRNQQKSFYDQQKLNNFIEETETDFSHISVEEIIDNHEDSNRKRNESLMTSETETKLLELLDEFERGKLFNNKNMSLPFLAGELNTNTKYLSYVINQHKSADFKSYINRLRINYIVDKIINDEKYRQYKISILADECGFSSHSKFASVFKAVTDFSPSAYIKLLDSENHKDNTDYFQENNQ